MVERTARASRGMAYAEISETLARYAVIIDDRDWDALDRVFTADATFDATSIGYRMLRSRAAIAQHMAQDARHPAAHLVLDPVADIDGGTAAVRSRLLGLMPDGRCFVGEYRDHFVEQDAGWRIAERVYSRLVTPNADAAPIG